MNDPMLVGEMEPLPVQILCSPGTDLEADLEAVCQFNYTPCCVASVDHALQDCEGCGCQRCCSASEAPCSCHVECARGLQALRGQGRPAGLIRLLECGPACACDTSCCPARPTQQGVTCELALFWHQQKGWCVKTLQCIQQGTFVAEYAGEYVSGSEAARRLAQYDQQARGHALLVVRIQLPSKMSYLKCSIDATKTGNVARFINHSCDGGNLEPVVVTSRGSLLPRVALFAARYIAQGEELTFSYSVIEGQDEQHTVDQAGSGSQTGASLRPCYCGAAACPGYLPSA